MNAHMSWEALNDYCDGILAPAARAEAMRHLDSCDECRQTVARLRHTIGEAAASPATVEPPAEAWTAIRAEIERRKVVPLPPATAPSRRMPHVRLVAAGLLLVLASSAVTALLMRRQDTPQIATGGPDTMVVPARVVALPASLVQMERGYLATVNELTTTLNASRAKLAPETVRAVERSLRIIDDAIAEAREALLRDPASDVLRGVWSKNYEQKVDLLRRASARAGEVGTD